MKKITCLYTVYKNLPDEIERIFSSTIGPLCFNHVLDSGIIRDIVAEKQINSQMEARILSLFDVAVNTGADIILCTCSTIGDYVEKAKLKHPYSRILRIDQPMAQYAIENYSRIAVVGTLETTITPSCRLIEKLARSQQKTVTVNGTLAKGAYDLLQHSQRTEALEIIKDTVSTLSPYYDVVLLAQASMGEFAMDLSNELQFPVLGSPKICAEYIKKTLV